MLKKTFMRGLGFLLLLVTLGLTSCQAFVNLFQAKETTEISSLILSTENEIASIWSKSDHGA